jgi:hypothetical protein
MSACAVWQQQSYLFGIIERSAGNIEQQNERNAVRLSMPICGRKREGQDQSSVLRQLRGTAEHRDDRIIQRSAHLGRNSHQVVIWMKKRQRFCDMVVIGVRIRWLRS